MSNLSDELAVILIIIWQLQKLDRLSVSKQAAKTFDMERYNLKNLNNVEVKEQYHVEISKRFTVLENLDDDMDVNRASESMPQPQTV
jgi:predicted glutamine amidotransferase